MNKQYKVKKRQILKKLTLENTKELGLKFAGKGQFGFCYLDEINRVIYKLFRVEPEAFSSISPFSLVKLKKLNLYRIAFPQNLIIRNFQIKGVSYDYIEGQTLEKFIINNEKITVDEFIKYYNELINIIPYLKKNNVEIVDLHCGNIIINQYGFHIIDVDGWNISKHFDYTQSNINQINQAMWEFITACNFIFDDPNDIIKDKDFKFEFMVATAKINKKHNLADIVNEIQRKIKNSNTYDELILWLEEYCNNFDQNEKKHK